MYQAIITKPAEMDIMEAVRHIAREFQNPVAAGRLLDDIESAVVSLEDYPFRHGLVSNEHLASLGFRYLPVQKYLIFYIVRENSKLVTIERFLHSRRDWMNIIGRC